MNNINIIEKYKHDIYHRYSDLKISGKTIEDMTNNDLCKIFEYYTCIKLSEEHDRPFFEYNDISPDFKEENSMSHNDTGIDFCDMVSTIGQCKLRKDALTWRECATFFASQVKKDESIWKLILARNSECKLSRNLLEKSYRFTDKQYSREEMINYCENLTVPDTIRKEEKITLRDYQIEARDKILNSKNIIICLPTGTGKNVIIINTIKEGSKYLVLVPLIILMDQFYDELIKHRPELKSKIQKIGDGNDDFSNTKLITICVYHSVGKVKNFDMFEKIFIDEAHHIEIPEIYKEEDEDNSDSDNNSDEEDNESDDECSDSDKSIKNSKDEVNMITDNIKYTDVIKNLYKYKNNVLLSATIDRKEGFDFYKKDIRDMIEKGYLSDYFLTCPIFSADPSNKNICEYLLSKYRSIIIYTSTQNRRRNT